MAVSNRMLFSFARGVNTRSTARANSGSSKSVGMQFNPAGLDFREVKHVIDQRQQMIGGLVDHAARHRAASV